MKYHSFGECKNRCRMLFHLSNPLIVCDKNNMMYKCYGQITLHTKEKNPSGPDLELEMTQRHVAAQFVMVLMVR